MRLTHASRLAVMLAVIAVGPGCATVVSGDAKPTIASVDLATLKYGAMVTEPTPYELRFGSFTAETVRMIEGRRLLNVLVHPMDFMPDLDEPNYTRIFANSVGMNQDGGLPAEFNDAVVPNDLVAGVTTSRTNGSVRDFESMFVGILEFGTEDGAKNAAAAMYQVRMSRAEPRQPVAVPGYPHANGSASATNMSVSQQHGPFVILASIQAPRLDQTMLVDTIKKSMDQQITALSEFTVIPADDLLDLPLDQDGIMRRAMGKSPVGDPLTMSTYDEDFGVFLPSGILHYERNTLEAQRAFVDAGVDLVGRRYSTIYRTRDVAAAFKLQTVLARRGKNDTVLEPPPGIADAQCVRLAEEDKNRGYNGFCVLVYDRYVAVVMSTASRLLSMQQVDATLQERTAAQYAILAKSE